MKSRPPRRRRRFTTRGAAPARRRKTTLDPSAIPAIVTAIRDRRTKRRITWDDVIDIVEETTGTRFSRQTLDAKSAIKSAYEAKIKMQQRDASSSGTRRKRSPAELTTLQALRAQIELRDRLIAERDATISAQNKRIDAFLEKFARWGDRLLSASNLTLDMLDTPLAPANRS
jgi:hypothetical protein